MMKGGIFGNLRNLEIDHYGIYVGDGKVVHNKPGVGWMLATGGGVELCSFEEFTGLGDGDGHQWVKVFNAHGMDFDNNVTSDEKIMNGLKFSGEEVASRAINRMRNAILKRISASLPFLNL
uniref:LRAT domain-containing protein n=1 Tax=Acrobeloides nanus TaxID=290746 RepID=A0A914CEM9_9BILA